MRSNYRQVNAQGRIENAGEGHGFAILSGRRGEDKTVRAGSYPFTVVLTDENNMRLEVVGPHCFYMKQRGSFDIEGATPGESFNVVQFDAPEEGVRSGGARVRLVTRIQSAKAAPTIAPVGNVGFQLRPGVQSWTVYRTGTAADPDCEVWIQDLDGVWYATGQIDLTASPVETRFVDTPAKAFYLQCNTAGAFHAIDYTEEAG